MKPKQVRKAQAKFKAKQISASSTYVEIEVRPGYSLTFFVELSSWNVSHDIRKVGWSNYHKQRIDEGCEIRLPYSEFMDVRSVAAQAIERERLSLLEKRSIVCTIQQPLADLKNRLVDVELSWEAGYSWKEGSAYLIFGAGRENHMYPKSRSGDYVPSAIYKRAMEQAEEAFAVAVGDTAYKSLFDNAMARKA